jgi:hypothetical protein
MEENMETLINMGFTDRELNRKALTKAGNDIAEAVTILTGPSYFNDDVMIPNEPIPPPTTPLAFIGPLTKEQIEQQQQQQQHMVR